MCQNNLARFRCAPTHAARQDGWGPNSDLKLKYIAKCGQARQNGLTCANRGTGHDLNDDEPNEDCPECKGETLLETL